MYEEIIYTEDKRREFLHKYNQIYSSAYTAILARSILGRDIDYYRLGTGKRNIVAVGAHHGMEYISSAATYDLIGFLSKKSTRGAMFCGVNLEILLQMFTFWLVPCLNPDGVELCTSGISKTPLYDRQVRMNGGSLDFSDWQANARGVDLNHNYAEGFFEYKRIEGAENISAGKTRFSGEYPESEPEVRGMANFIRTVMPDAVISFHTQGGEIFSSPKDSRTARIAERLADAVGYKALYPTAHARYGGLCDYTGQNLGIPSFTVELGRGKNPLPHGAYPALCDTARKLVVTLCKLL